LQEQKRETVKCLNVIEESVFQRGLHQFSNLQKVMLLQGYVTAKRGSRKLYEGLQTSFLKSSFSELTVTDISRRVWYISKAENDFGPQIYAGLFDKL